MQPIRTAPMGRRIVVIIGNAPVIAVGVRHQDAVVEWATDDPIGTVLFARGVEPSGWWELPPVAESDP